LKVPTLGEQGFLGRPFKGPNEWQDAVYGGSPPKGGQTNERHPGGKGGDRLRRETIVNKKWASEQGGEVDEFCRRHLSILGGPLRLERCVKWVKKKWMIQERKVSNHIGEGLHFQSRDNVKKNMTEGCKSRPQILSDVYLTM